MAFDARGHGRSDAPHDPARYGDERAAADLMEVVAAFAGPPPVIVGYSMGSATALWALVAGLDARAVLGAVPSAVLGVVACRRRAARRPRSRCSRAARRRTWRCSGGSTSSTQRAPTGSPWRRCCGRHRPVVEHWEAITAPIVVATGVDDAGAAPVAALLARLADARAIDLPGDHVRAAASTEFTDAVIEVAFG